MSGAEGGEDDGEDFLMVTMMVAMCAHRETSNAARVVSLEELPRKNKCTVLPRLCRCPLLLPSALPPASPLPLSLPSYTPLTT